MLNAAKCNCGEECTELSLGGEPKSTASSRNTEGSMAPAVAESTSSSPRKSSSTVASGMMSSSLTMPTSSAIATSSSPSSGRCHGWHAVEDEVIRVSQANISVGWISVGWPLVPSFGPFFMRAMMRSRVLTAMACFSVMIKIFCPFTTGESRHCRTKALCRGIVESVHLHAGHRMNRTTHTSWWQDMQYTFTSGAARKIGVSSGKGPLASQPRRTDRHRLPAPLHRQHRPEKCHAPRRQLSPSARGLGAELDD